VGIGAGHSIEQLDAAAIPSLVALWEDCGLTRPWNDAAGDARMAMEGPASAILGIRNEGTTVGSVMVGFDGHRGWVYYLAVAPGHRRSGLGRSLMAAAEDWLRERDAPAVRLMVREENEVAGGFYRAIGYETQHVATLGKRLGSDQLKG
jgi:ribosomal protein S18 acetylase RimI-like enzyme